MVLSWSLEAIVYYLVLLDAIVANVIVHCCQRWYKKSFRGWWTKYFPMTTGWALIYLILVLWVGWALSRLGVLTF